MILYTLFECKVGSVSRRDISILVRISMLQFEINRFAFFVNFERLIIINEKIIVSSRGWKFVNLLHKAGFKKIINFSHLPTLIF